MLAASPNQSLGITGTPHDNHHAYQLTAITSVGIRVTVISFILLLVLVFLIRRKSREHDDSEDGSKTRAPSIQSGRKTQDGTMKSQLNNTRRLFFSLGIFVCIFPY